VEINVQGKHLSVKGPKGELNWSHPERVTVAVEEGRGVVKRADDSKPTRACHGLVRSILQNMVTGVSEGYTRVLEITGVGYRAQVKGDTIAFSLGHSHPIEFKLPPGIKAESDKKQVVLTLTGIDKQLIGQVAADIKALRPPDSYKGKGVRYRGERIRLKAGKAAK
jgi:large subunit ribosomal protein L6